MRSYSAGALLRLPGAAAAAPTLDAFASRQARPREHYTCLVCGDQQQCQQTGLAGRAFTEWLEHQSAAPDIR